MAMYGAIDAMRSATGPMLQAQAHLSYAALGSIFAANSIGYLLGSFASGFTIHRVGLRKTLLIGSLTMGTILVLIITLHAYAIIWIAFCVLGITMGWLEIGVNGVIPAVASNAKTESAMFNLLHGFYGVGATIFPTIVIWIATKSGHWATPFLGVGFITLLGTLMIVRYRFPTMAEEAKATDAQSAERKTVAKSALTSPLLYSLVIAITLYVIAEAGTAAWLPTYLVHVNHYSIAKSSMYLTGFYLVFTIGRLTGPLWVPRLGTYGSIAFSCILSILLFSMPLVHFGHPWLFMVAGFGMSVTFPNIVHLASQNFPRETGRVLGVLFTFAGIGGISVSFVIGIVASTFGISVAFYIIPIALAAVLVLTYLSKWLEKNHRSKSTTVLEANPS